ncbi:MAG: SUMF1/EgtB/PvdO family nonheme iron enzyme [Bryobacteraceae bacterium]|nr:SUMF1/EgtB/PvdO family nonheme iron enzyme [Bryobacteraceae bacterium]
MNRRKTQSGAVSGTVIVAILLAIVASTAGGLIWYKQQPQVLPPARNDDNGIMLLIPAGPFLQGETKQQAVAPAFYIDRTEVTNRMYAAFCRATGHALPENFPADKPNLPVVDIAIEDATAFAKYAGKRLPDALEWEKAFRGAGGRVYPWGDTPDNSKANVEAKELILADAMPEGGSQYNILQMAGNAAEFVRTVNPPTPADVERMASQMTPAPTAKEAWYGVKGGAFNQTLAAALPWKYEAVPARFHSPFVGFRCVRDATRR